MTRTYFVTALPGRRRRRLFPTGRRLSPPFRSTRPPGSFWNYSNPNFSLAGLIAERASGLQYHQYMKDRVCGPAGMTSATMLPSDVLAYGDYAYEHYTDPFTGQDRDRRSRRVRQLGHGACRPRLRNRARPGPICADPDEWREPDPHFFLRRNHAVAAGRHADRRPDLLWFRRDGSPGLLRSQSPNARRKCLRFEQQPHLGARLHLCDLVAL